jgi:hypothetical protein
MPSRSWPVPTSQILPLYDMSPRVREQRREESGDVLPRPAVRGLGASPSEPPMQFGPAVHLEHGHLEHGGDRWSA